MHLDATVFVHVSFASGVADSSEEDHADLDIARVIDGDVQSVGDLAFPCTGAQDP